MKLFTSKSVGLQLKPFLTGEDFSFLVYGVYIRKIRSTASFISVR